MFELKKFELGKFFLKFFKEPEILFELAKVRIARVRIRQESTVYVVKRS